jgi:hypothetical protein
MRRFSLVLAVAATCVALGLPAAAGAAPSPAPATSASVTPHGGGGSSFIICFPVFIDPPGITVWQCYTIQIPQQVVGPGDGGCPPCGEAIDLTYDPAEITNPKILVGDLGQGYGLLGQAAVSTVPAEAAKLHAAAINEFTAAAKSLGSTRLGAKQVGYVDPASGRFNPESSPWRQQAGTDVLKGIANLQTYLAKGDTRSLASATAALDDSYQVLAENAGTQATG